MRRSRRRVAGTIAVLATAGLTVLAVGATSEAASHTGTGEVRPVISPLDVEARGADVPFVEQEAESAATNGSVLGPDRTAGTLASEASGRTAISLQGQGSFVEFTLTEPANSVVVRYSVPDSAGGTGIDATLSLYVDGADHGDLDLTSRYAWFYGSYPFTNDPAAGNAHHFYDETRALLGSTLPAGSKVKVQVDAGDAAPSYAIDLADFEQVAAPATRPDGSLSVVDFGATPDDAGEDADAFDAAIAAAREQGAEVWIPAGVFVVNRHITVDQVTLRGAGHWHTELRGERVGVYGLGEPASCGQGGNTGVSTGVGMHDFAIIGEVDERVDCDQVNGIGGAIGGGSVISGLWIQHTKVGLWLDGPFDGLTVAHNRILDQTADGLNLHKGVSNVVVEHNFVRNSGDDGLAMWSETVPNHDNVFRFNTVIAPILANNIAIYGGADISVTDNVVTDTQTQGGGIHVANRFAATPVAGTHTLARNTTIRAGVLDPNWQFGVGALWFDGRDGPMTATIDVSDTQLLDSSYEAIHFIGNGVSGVSFTDVTIDGAGTFAVQLQTTGSATFTNVVATGVGHAGIYNCQGEGAFTITDGGGNAGWEDTYCGPWPDPVYSH
jgi:hypothetical protein